MDNVDSPPNERKAISSVDGTLLNSTVSSLSWSNISVLVKDKATGHDKHILTDLTGSCRSGEIIALMGPSGSGKTTLLNVLAHRVAASHAKVSGEILINGEHQSLQTIRQLSSYVEQEDALIGSLTVRETIDFAARLAGTSPTSTTRRRLVQGLLDSFGLSDRANALIGTPIRKGISGGQKRRVSVASQLITSPKILFLDEPTSGLDSAASFEVMSFIKQTAQRLNLIVVASIHQPSTTTFNIFDQVLFLSQGKTVYYGSVSRVNDFFASIGFPIPPQFNPAEAILDLTNVDFGVDRVQKQRQLEKIQEEWCKSGDNQALCQQVLSIEAFAETGRDDNLVGHQKLKQKWNGVLILLHRNFIKSYRDLIAYGVRLIMYLGLAIMMGTVWLRLGSDQKYIQPYINAIFFGSAFMSFMAVAYVPAFLEDRSNFVKERANGLYGPTTFLVANFLVGLPYLFLIALLFSSIAYWLSNFHPTGGAFMMWVMWLFLDLVAAESLVVLVSSIFPNFVIALALIAFANGLWMSVGGFLVTPTILNVFWKYVFSYIDYQKYVFQGMMVNQFQAATYDCGAGCACMYQSALASDCKIAGDAVLKYYGYDSSSVNEWVGIMLSIIAGYRLLCWAVSWARKS